MGIKKNSVRLLTADEVRRKQAGTQSNASPGSEDMIYITPEGIECSKSTPDSIRIERGYLRVLMARINRVV